MPGFEFGFEFANVQPRVLAPAPAPSVGIRTSNCNRLTKKLGRATTHLLSNLCTYVCTPVFRFVFAPFRCTWYGGGGTLRMVCTVQGLGARLASEHVHHVCSAILTFVLQTRAYR